LLAKQQPLTGLRPITIGRVAAYVTVILQRFDPHILFTLCRNLRTLYESPRTPSPVNRGKAECAKPNPTTRHEENVISRLVACAVALSRRSSPPHSSLPALCTHIQPSAPLNLDTSVEFWTLCSICHAHQVLDCGIRRNFLMVPTEMHAVKFVSPPLILRSKFSYSVGYRAFQRNPREGGVTNFTACTSVVGDVFG
jgi:hypothetical protein